MKINFDLIYKKLEELFIQKLPDYIDKINIEYNDGIIIEPFKNQSLTENCLKLPSFVFDIIESHYSENDRIIESVIYTFSFEIKLSPIKKFILEFARYVSAIEKMLEENKIVNNIKITRIKNKTLILQIQLYLILYCDFLMHFI